MKKTCLLFLILLLPGILVAQQTRHVVIVVMDGIRYSETFGDTAHSYIPRIWSTLRPKGVIYTSYRNEGLTETNPGHSTIVTGTWQYIANDGSVRPTSPTMFEYYRFQKGTTANENFVVLGKTKLGILTYSANSNYGSSYGASVKYSSSQYSDPIAWENFKMVVTSFHPRLMIVNLPASDNAGHSGIWSAYTSAIRDADSLVNEIWTYIQADPALAGNTTMIVSNDHGRHLDSVSTGFKDHGDGCEGCRHIMLLVVGPDTPAGIVDSTAAQQVDIAPTVGKLLGFTVPTAIGKVLASAVVTSVDEQLNLPHQVELYQNYPNPFNPVTVIEYAVGGNRGQELGTSDVRLVVCDILGRDVAVLVNERKVPGSYEVKFDASGLPSGVYFYRLTAGDFAQTRKLLLVK